MPIRTLLALLLLLPAAAPAQELDLALRGVVKISGSRGGAQVQGSGFVVGLEPGKATIVTASHVIEGMPQFEVTFAADPTESFSGGAVLGIEPRDDHGLAVFQVRGAIPEGVSVVSFEFEERPNLGDDLFLVGFPAMELAPRTPRRVLVGRRGTLLLIDQEIGEGFSGSPVLQSGKVVGVVTDTDGGTTLAVTAVIAREALEGWGVKPGISTPSPPPPVEPSCRPGEGTTVDGIVFVQLCAGTFLMGSGEDDSRAETDERPAHKVTLREFRIGKYEITNEQYRKVKVDHPGDPKLPATDINWSAAKTFCEKLEDGRLPTEAEWEYAARAGGNDAWSFGDRERALGEHAWYVENSGEKAHPVGEKKANVWGLYDMHGNVCEWVTDWFGRYRAEAQENPAGPSTGEERVLRGGSFLDSPRDLRSAFRDSVVPTYRGKDIGFRCVLAPRRQSRFQPLSPVEQPCKSGEEKMIDGIVFVRLCAGSFTMGSRVDGSGHQVQLSEFWISKTEFTNEHYRQFHSNHQGEASIPVTNITWYDAKATCEHFGGRLLTEAEWEYATSFSTRAAWPYGDYRENGNFWEWVTDWYGRYSSAPQIDPTGPTIGEFRVLRKGPLPSAPSACRPEDRGSLPPKSWDNDVGFRCVLEASSRP